ncbi:pantetheinase-like [Ruditapes philippinarum]|uniref:pantetheinase-like n=1 Tax=Ruditapes philippinarum TaxID=129788 RepID=UPI00295BE6DA|nr:pantetheinase-like [Ruditapes philippinarum]
MTLYDNNNHFYLQDVDIIVFPENGIYGYKLNSPSDIENYLEFIPDPSKVNWTPCIEPDRYKRTRVQAFLSCLAMNNSMYLVANYGDRQPCLTSDSNCPRNGYYQYNTNIVYNREGTLIARYHKQNLFLETQFQQPVNAETVFFDTDFGRFGTLTCFDILFKSPVINLLEQVGVTDIVFTTAWMDALPFFTAIGYHSSFAHAYNVNFLSANLHNPSERIQGSGIYTPDGALSYYYDRSSQNGRLLVTHVPVISNDRRVFTKFTINTTEIKFLRKHEFQGRLFGDIYNFISLRSKNEKVTICYEDFCCFLSYDRDEIKGNYAFGVFSGIHTNNGPYFLQVCILLKCGSEDNSSCGRYTYHADGNFKYFNMRGNFSTPYITPQVVTSRNGTLELPLHFALKFDANGLTGSSTMSPLLETSLVGRIYERDKGSKHVVANDPRIVETSWVTILFRSLCFCKDFLWALSNLI